jgi:hypothetical protein
MGAEDEANYAKYFPKDLDKDNSKGVVQDYFTVSVVNLKIDNSYPFNFQWVFPDGTRSKWSDAYVVNTSTESVPAAPTNTVTGGAGFIKVSLPTFPANALRVDVRIAGGTFGSGTVVAESFTSAGVKTIAALGAASPGNAYVVTLLTVTPSKINGDPSSPVTVYVTDPSAALVVTSPQDPFAPTVRSGLASVIVEWSGKKSDGTDLTLTGFSGAKVHIGTSSNFTPSADNWVHTLNFANGSNRVSIGVGSIIDKTVGTTLEYGTAYHIKLVATNASGSLSSAVSASNNPVTVAKLPASEISTGILTADASITAGVSGGQRVVISGSSAPLIIYGTDGTTKLLEYVTSGTTGSLAIKGSGTFSGDISAAGGTFTGNVTTSGNISASNGLFTVNNGLLTAQSGTIGGWTITGSVLESAVVSTNKITLNPATPKIALIQNGTEKITIDPVEGIKDSTGNFILTPAGNLTLKGSLTISTNPTYNYWTVDGFRAGAASTYLTTNVSSGVTTIYSSDTTTDTTDGNTSGIAVPQKIEVNSTQVIIQGLAGVGNGLTRYGDLIGYTAGVADSFITQYRSAGYSVAGNEPSATYGAAARYRMIVADPYDYNKLKRGFGVYYGVRSSAPTSSTGFVGDVWLSW